MKRFNFLVRVLSSGECICEDTSTDVDYQTLVKKVTEFLSLFFWTFNYKPAVLMIMPSVIKFVYMNVLVSIFVVLPCMKLDFKVKVLLKSNTLRRGSNNSMVVRNAHH